MDAFVALDFETANAHRGSACSCAFVKFNESGEEIDRFSTLLHPHESLDYFSPINTWIHGITANDVVDAPSWADVYPQIVDFIGDLPIVAHSMAFDGYVLTDLDRLYEKEPLLNRRYCTVRLARRLFPDMEYRGLFPVFEHYFPDEYFNHHDAATDAWACGKIFAQMQKDLGIERISDLCPQTGPGTIHERSRNKDREWVYVARDSIEYSELIERFSGTDSLQGQRVCFTGTLTTAPRATMQLLVEELGGAVEKSLTKKTTILVVGIPNPAAWAEGASASRKLQKATALRESGSPITVMGEEDFLHFLQDGMHPEEC
ncbi:exonuclease domain-containing protein [Actinomyces vulturis]|uniref:exonuclease domain-containing protein n=1 Tax=Actinomyces vulturis TaxID=1857645 RepID=UPI0008298689|nr:exonuclease domain-containing protein [Actinomyces vulturis]